MTFSGVVAEVLATLNLTSTEATARVGRAVNAWHRRVTSSIGMNMTRRTSVTQACTAGVQTVTFEGLTSLERVRDASSGSVRVLDEVLYDELRRETPGTADPRRFAIKSKDDSSVTIYLDAVPQDTRELVADGLGNASTLSGSQTPVFPEDFHDILVLGALSDEYRKMDKRAPAKDTLDEAERRMGELRMYLAKSEALRIRQNDRPAVSSSGGGSASPGAASGTTSYTQSGLVTFDRNSGEAPFAVADTDAAYVPNLGAEFIGNVATDRLLGRDTAGTGESEQITVGGGVEFTGSGGLQRSALTGDVTASAGGTVATIANDAVTYVKMQNVSAASRVLGRGSAGGAGNVEELTVGAGLTIAATDLSVNVADANLVLAMQVFS